MLRVLGPLLAMACLAQSSRPPYPVWPQQFTAEAIQSQNGSLQYTTLYYDWPGGRNLILIQEQQGALTWDMEWTNGTSYFFNREANTCRELSFPVGVLRPEWLENATYLGIERVDNIECHKWTKSKFIDYWASTSTGNPVRWVFLWTGAVFDVITFKANQTVPDESYWQAPASCFQADKIS